MSDVEGGNESSVAIDFETAASDRSYACAPGVVVFEQGKPTTERRLLSRPPGNEYDTLNTAMHGIGPRDTEKSPGFPAVKRHAGRVIGERSVVAHNTALTFP